MLSLSPVPEPNRIRLKRADSSDLRQASFLRTAIDAATKELPENSIGASWCADQTTLKHRLPMDDKWGFFLYRNPAGPAHQQNHLSHWQHYSEMHDFVRVEGNRLAIYLSALRNAFVDDAPEEERPAGFILRRNSLILFYANEQDGILLMAPHAGGHDSFEEIEAVERDFNGQFTLTHD